MKKIEVEFSKVKPSDSYISEDTRVYALGNKGKKWFVTWGKRGALKNEVSIVDSDLGDNGVKWFPVKKEAEQYMRAVVKEIYRPLMDAAGYKEERDCFFRRFVNPDYYPTEEPEVEELKNEALRLGETLGTVNAIDVYNESAVYGFGSLEGNVGPWIAEGDFRESLALAKALAEKIGKVRARIDDLKERWPAHSVQPHFITELEDLEDRLEDLKGVRELQIIKEYMEKEKQV